MYEYLCICAFVHLCICPSGINNKGIIILSNSSQELNIGIPYTYIIITIELSLGREINQCFSVFSSLLVSFCAWLITSLGQPFFSFRFSVWLLYLRHSTTMSFLPSSYAHHSSPYITPNPLSLCHQTCNSIVQLIQ